MSSSASAGQDEKEPVCTWLNIAIVNVSNLIRNVACSQSKTGQEIQRDKDKMDQQEKFHKEFSDFLTFVKDKPDIYCHPRLKYLREFVSIVSRFPRQYVDGDDTVSMPLPPSDRGFSLTKGYVQSIANTANDRETCDNPILSVLAHKAFRKRDNSNSDTPESIKYNELTLVDGDGEKIHARLNRNLVEVGCMLKIGDMIRLDLFTQLRFRINSGSPHMPMLFIHGLSRVGTCHLADSDVKTVFMKCEAMPMAKEPTLDDDYFVIDPRKHDKPCCTNEHRYCAMYGLRFVTCVCDAIPLDNLNLETIKADCYFATDEVADMSNSHKRNMVYWWFATNVYTIVGKGNIEHLPLCLEYAIREKWPNPDDLPYKGNRKRNSKKRK